MIVSDNRDTNMGGANMGDTNTGDTNMGGANMGDTNTGDTNTGGASIVFGVLGGAVAYAVLGGWWTVLGAAVGAISGCLRCTTPSQSEVPVRNPFEQLHRGNQEGANQPLLDDSPGVLPVSVRTA